MGQSPASAYHISIPGLHQHISENWLRHRSRILYPSCESGVSEWHVVAKYKMERAPEGSGKYRSSTLYCGTSGFGFRHLEPHIGQYFGGWPNFNFSITQTQRAPASITYRESNDTYTRATSGDAGARIITAYGSKGKTVDSPCP